MKAYLEAVSDLLSRQLHLFSREELDLYPVRFLGCIGKQEREEFRLRF